MDKEWLGQGKSDPYAILRITSDGEMSTFKTSVIDNSLHPVWNMSGITAWLPKLATISNTNVLVTLQSYFINLMSRNL